MEPINQSSEVNLSPVYESIQHLMDKNVSELERFTLYGISTFGKVVSLYDGDTFDIVFSVPISCFTQERFVSKKKKGVCMICEAPNYHITMRQKCRLEGVDAQELKTDQGKRAKEILEGLILNKIVKCEFKGQDKYGRQLIRIFLIHLLKEVDLSVYLQQYSDCFCHYDGGKRSLDAFDG
jgi:endonuclease YncB( thermonuclease family)